MTNQIESFDFLGMASKEIAACQERYSLSLTAAELVSLQQDILGRKPTLAECILWSIQGSEHCSYRSSKTYLKTLPTQGSQVICGAREDAGIVRLASDARGRTYGLVISHESHNHPSQILPFEGAATGVGGNVRDVCCMGAEVIANADMLRFGEITRPKTQWIKEGVVSGIASYGNALGIPNIAGDVFFDERYNDNCLVSVVSIGVVLEDNVIHSYAPKEGADYDLILVGKPTDRSGFGGARFASVELASSSQEQDKACVQEPNAFLERHLLKANYSLFEKLARDNLVGEVGFKDLGAGGIACASVELADASGFGADIFLDDVFVTDCDIDPCAILCSETQERFMWVAKPTLSRLILEHYNKTFALDEVCSGAQAKVIGKIRESGRYRVFYRGEQIVDAMAKDVTKGITTIRQVTPPDFAVEISASKPSSSNKTEALLQRLSHENCASRHPIFERYDKQVQGRTILERGQSCAGVIAPFNDREDDEALKKIGVALAVAHYPPARETSPYACARHAVLQAMRKVVASGARPLALTDCLCFGSPEKPQVMWEFAEAVRGIKEVCEEVKAFSLVDEPFPVIAGNVSFYNESAERAIPPSPLVSCVGRMDDWAQALPNTFMQSGSSIVLTQSENAREEMNFVLQCHALGYLLSARVIENGGLGAELAQMCFLDKGCILTVDADLLFAKIDGFILEIRPEASSRVEKIARSFSLIHLGQTSSSGRILVGSEIDVSTKQAHSLWVNGLMREGK